MKILISNDNPFAHFYIRMSLARVLSVMGHDVVMWDIHQKSAYDAFDEFNPDLFIGQTYNINRGIITCLKERPDCNVIMKASDFGEISDQIDRKKYPVLIASEEEKENVKRLLEETNRPDFVYVHYHPDRLESTHGHWKRDFGLRLHSLMNAADVLEYANGVEKPEYKCDFCFLGGRWGYKSITLDRWLLPLLERTQNYNVKIFGNQSWGISQYCGFLPESETRHLFASSKIGVNLSEPHSQDLGYDIIERPFKLMIAKRCVLSDYVEDLEKIFPENELELATTPTDFKEKLDELLEDEYTRNEMGEFGYKAVLKNHTYFHRVRDIFVSLGMDDQAEMCMKKFDEIKTRLKL